MGKRAETSIEPPADRVIRLFGGVGEVANVVGVSTVQIHRWRYPKARGGHDGNVPPRHHEMLLRAAARRGISLAPADLMPWLGSAA